MYAFELLRPALEPPARAALEGRFEPVEIESILDEAFNFVLNEIADLGGESVGARLMVRLASLTSGLYHALLKRVDNEVEARTLTTSVTWRLYEKMGKIPWALAGVGSRDEVDRLRRATNAFRSFPFGPPGFELVDAPVEDPRVVSFDVLRCPVAEYFTARGLGQLCIDTWCNLDYTLAKTWGAELTRDTQLASGDDRCRFRWRVLETND